MKEELIEDLSNKYVIDTIDKKELIDTIVVVINDLIEKIGDRELIEGLAIIKLSRYGEKVLDHLREHRGFTTKTIQADFCISDTTLYRIRKRLVQLGLLFNATKASDLGGMGRKSDIWLIRGTDPKYARAIERAHLELLKGDRAVRDDFRHQEECLARDERRAHEEAKVRLLDNMIEEITRRFAEEHERTDLPPNVDLILRACRGLERDFDAAWGIALRLLEIDILPWIYKGGYPDPTWKSFPREWSSVIEASDDLTRQLDAIRSTSGSVA